MERKKKVHGENPVPTLYGEKINELLVLVATSPSANQIELPMDFLWSRRWLTLTRTVLPKKILQAAVATERHNKLNRCGRVRVQFHCALWPQRTSSGLHAVHFSVICGLAKMNNDRLGHSCNGERNTTGSRFNLEIRFFVSIVGWFRVK